MVFDVVLVEPLLELLGALVVQAVELGLAAPFGECAVDVRDGVGDGLSSSIFDGLQEDVVAIVIVGDNQVVVACARRVG